MIQVPWRGEVTHGGGGAEESKPSYQAFKMYLNTSQGALTPILIFPSFYGVIDCSLVHTTDIIFSAPNSVNMLPITKIIINISREYVQMKVQSEKATEFSQQTFHNNLTTINFFIMIPFKL